ncbi:hypothetical protein AB1Y20_002522 [Prymnesium parvum]|uniref:Cytochrome c oxidase subunit 5C n=1 Tax=Prymnesium parvum TaxID=97485 RepID=A0AB34J979_PRYPA|eukprot:CAMPEP_0182809864 /NCGR_PEP_ID=MMETSP0006_2-20121128/7421_1 /TAXON_ID=97485 /ORGANISM="Prymnesium parvum, Strain Texoma1" /LENGTH=71 /DNA_ID=CAMNT_0024935697 /DNA_START=29 /DNA_END=244 /DNA_ORIENTATION=+
MALFTRALPFRPSVRGARWAAEYTGEIKQKAFQMIIEGCVVGTIFAFAWRWSHMKEKARVHAYYKKLREEA